MDFSKLAILIVGAGTFGLIAKLFKQPLLVGYLFAGFVLGMMGFIDDSEVLADMGKVGVALLLFLLGLEMKLDELPKIGRVAVLTGIGQIVFTTGIGVIISLLLGFSYLSSLYLGIALAFSSTIIIVKLLSEKKDLSSLYGRISVGFLLVQDFVAIVILMFLSGLGTETLEVFDYILMLVKALILFFFIGVLSKKFLPYFFDKIVATSSELLFIVSIAWALGVSSLVAGPVGFTLEIGGFLAGIALSNLPEHLQIASRVRPLRDFFLTIFFVFLGTHLATGMGALELMPHALVFSAFVLFGNPLIVLIILGVLGYKKRTSFLSGLTVAQISEFSLIVVTMGMTVGHLTNDDGVLTIIVVVAAITMTVSTYMILGADKLYKMLQPYLGIFEKKKTKEIALMNNKEYKDHVVLVGSDRTGGVILEYLLRKKMKVVVVDFNPVVFDRLSANNVDVLFGDINDDDILEAAGLDKARLVISTIANFSDNLTFMDYIKSLEKKPNIIITSSSRREAIKLYETGADYVMVPEVVTGDHIKHIISHYFDDLDKLSTIGEKHFNKLLFY